MNKDEFKALIVNNGKKWLTDVVTVDGQQVGIKAYGLWVQRITCNGLTSSSSMHTTKRDFRAEVGSLVDSMVKPL